VNERPIQATDAEILESGRATFRAEAEAVRAVGDRLDGAFVRAVRLILAGSGRVLLTGLGKSGLVARKVAATLTATGTPSHFIHPVEAAHGDLGIVGAGDVLIAVSRSGENPEVVNLLVLARHFGMRTIGITGAPASSLAAHCDVILACPVEREACPLNLTPTSSAAAAMAMGDALALSLLKLRGFSKDDFATFHPSGVLGRSLLLTVGELMHSGDELPLVSHRLSLRAALPEIVEKRLGGTCVVDDDGLLAGVCVDGDVKRFLLAHDDALDRPITEAMGTNPTTVRPEELALTALRLMERRAGGPVTLLIVVDGERRPVGLLHIHDVLRAGIL
jgi:arabinose-5-phosphate isomerase